MRKIDEIRMLPISTSQEDLRDRIDFIFSIINEAQEVSNADIAQAFSDVLSYQSYAGAVPLDYEGKLLHWIDETFEESALYIDAIASIYCMMSSEKAFFSLKEKLFSSSLNSTKKILQEAVDEFEINT